MRLDKLDSESQLFRYPAKRDGNAAALPKELHQFSRSALEQKLKEVAEIYHILVKWDFCQKFFEH